MIYLLYGDDHDKAREKAHSIIDSLLAKRPDASFFRLDAESWNPDVFEGYIGGLGLFSANYVVLLDYILENEEAESEFLSKLKELEASNNVFIVLEGELKKSVAEKIGKKSAKTQEFSKRASVPKREFNNFALADALGKRDKKELWVLYQQSALEEKAPEEIHGVLFWQLKSMLQAAQSKSADEAGLKPFVYSKSKRYAENFEPLELKRKSAELVSILHDARRGGDELDNALERWILGL